MTAVVRGLSAIVGKAPWAVLAAIVILTSAFGVLATRVQVAAGNEGFAPDTPEIDAVETLSERFGDSSEEVVQILVQAPGERVVSADGLRAARAVDEAVRDSQAADKLADRDDRPSVVSWMVPVEMAAQQGIDPDALDDAAIAEVFTETLAAMPPGEADLLGGLLPGDAAADDADTALVLVFLAAENGADWDAIIATQEYVADAVRAAPLPDGFTAEPFSFPLLFSDDGTFESELARLFATAFAIIIVILAFVYWLHPRGSMRWWGSGRRTLTDVALTMATIVMAITWMNGAATLLGPDWLGWIGPLTEVTQIVPVLLIGLGVDYAIHLTSRYREEASGGQSVLGSVRGAVHTVGVALILATITTAVGFLTNVFNPVPTLQDFGVIAAVGIVSAFLLMLTFVPSARLVLDRRAERSGRLPREAFATTSQRLLPGIMSRVAVLAERTPIPTLLVTVVAGGALGIYGLTQLETRFSTTDFVPQDDPILATFDTILERFDGGFGETTQVLLTGPVATPAAHNALVETTERLADVQHVAVSEGRAQALSPVTLLGQALAPAPDGSPPPAELQEQAAAAGLGPDLRVNEDADVAALYGVLFDTVPGAEQVLTREPGDAFLGRVAIQTTAGEEGAADLIAGLDAAFAPAEAAGVVAVATSTPIINHVIINELQSSQASSLLITLLAAGLLLVLAFWVQHRRPLLGLITIAPVALVVLWTFGMMAATNIPFGPVTATIAALAIGIGVPYTIHITHRYQEDRLRYATMDEALRSTVQHTGGALAGSAFTTCAGFGVLVTSSLVPFRQFGMVTVYAIGFALLAATFVLPSMLALWDRWHRRGGRPAVSGRTRPAHAASKHGDRLTGAAQVKVPERPPAG